MTAATATAPATPADALPACRPAHYSYGFCEGRFGYWLQARPRADLPCWLNVPYDGPGAPWPGARDGDQAFPGTRHYEAAASAFREGAAALPTGLGKIQPAGAVRLVAAYGGRLDNGAKNPSQRHCAYNYAISRHWALCPGYERTDVNNPLGGRDTHMGWTGSLKNLLAALRQAADYSSQQRDAAPVNYRHGGASILVSFRCGNHHFVLPTQDQLCVRAMSGICSALGLRMTSRGRDRNGRVQLAATATVRPSGKRTAALDGKSKATCLQAFADLLGRLRGYLLPPGAAAVGVAYSESYTACYATPHALNAHRFSHDTSLCLGVYGANIDPNKPGGVSLPTDLRNGVWPF